MAQREAALYRIKNSIVPRGALNSLQRLFSPALLALMAAGAVVRFLFLARTPFWFDECFSVEVARLDGPNFLRLL